MTTSFEQSKKKTFNLLSIGFLLLSLLTLSSCLKDDYENNQTPAAALTVVHAAPDAPAIDFVINRRLVSPPNLSYATRITYFILNPGTYTASFYKTGTNSDALLERTIALSSGQYHSLFFTGSVTDSLTSLLIQDDLTLPAEGKAKLRLVQLSPDSPSLDLSLSSDSVFAGGLDFLDYTEFKEVPAGTYQARFSTHSDQKNVLDFELKLTAGKIYTVVARGLLHSEVSDQKLENGLIVHDF